MLSLIKEVQSTSIKIETIVETCLTLEFECILLEDLSGTMLSYVQQIRSGKQWLTYNNISEIANVFAFGDLLGAMDNRKINTRAASALIDVFKGVTPSNSSESYQRIMTVVDKLGPRVAEHFKRAAADWGNTLSAAIENPSQQVMSDIANKLVSASHTIRAAVEHLQTAQQDSIQHDKVQQGMMGNQLDQSILGSRKAAGL